MAFNPNEHLLELKSRDGSKDYLPVQWRLVWFREQCPQGTIDTEELEVDVDREVEAEAFAWNAEKRRSEKIVKRAKGYARYKAIVTDGKGGRATGTKSENAANFADYVEKAETGAIGRALAALGYGTQFTGDEFNESHRIVDAPVERAASSQAAAGEQAKASTPKEIRDRFNALYVLAKNKGKIERKAGAEDFLKYCAGVLLLKEFASATATSQQLDLVEAAINSNEQLPAAL